MKLTKLAMMPLLLVLPIVPASAGCAAATEEDVESDEAEISQVFRSALEDRGRVPLEAKEIHYPEDARPFERARMSVAQTPGGSRYVAYSFKARKGDGLLLAAQTSDSFTSCNSVARLWLLDADNRVVKTGTRQCVAERDVPRPQSKSNILRHYLEKGGAYKLVVAVLPARDAAADDPVRTEPWTRLSVEMVRTHAEDQGASRARCQDGIDVFCDPALRCERARCK
jgi:hypothetical protein